MPLLLPDPYYYLNLRCTTSLTGLTSTCFVKQFTFIAHSVIIIFIVALVVAKFEDFSSRLAQENKVWAVLSPFIYFYFFSKLCWGRP